MADEKKSAYPMDQQQAAYPPAGGGYQPAGGAPPPYYQPPGQPGYPPQEQQQGYPYPPQPQGNPSQFQGYPTQPGYAPAPQQPGQTVIVRQTQMQPNDYLGFAIFVTICCCLPFGIVGIVKASEVRSRFAAGDYQGAEESSTAAKNWSCAGLVTGCIVLGSFFIFYVLLYVVILGAGVASYNY